jgi:hypothetical protein
LRVLNNLNEFLLLKEIQQSYIENEDCIIFCFKEVMTFPHNSLSETYLLALILYIRLFTPIAIEAIENM